MAEKPTESSSTLSKSVSVSALIMRLGIAAQTAYILLYYGLGGLLLFQYPRYFWDGAIYAVCLCIALVSMNLFWGWARATKAYIIIPYGLSAYIFADNLWNQIFRVDRALNAFIDIWYITGLLLIIAAFALVWLPIHLIIAAVDWNHNRKKAGATKADSLEKGVNPPRVTHISMNMGPRPRIASILITVIIGVSFFSALQYRFNIIPTSETITIDPGTTQIELAFWGSMNPAKYSDTAKEQLNNHSCVIFSYDNPLINETTMAWARPYWVDCMNYWKTNYPNVKFMVVALGVPGGFTWDGSATGTIQLIETYMNIAEAEHLTNIIGFNTDQEEPQTGEKEDIARNRERNAEATRIWNEFFQRVAANATMAKYEFQTTFGGISLLDTYDGDTDLDVYARNNILTVPYWDEYAPMYYMNGPHDDPAIESVSADEEHYSLYLWMQILHDALDLNGLADRIGCYIGITGMGIFSNQTEHTVNGQPAGKGFEALVEQGKIVKSFGAKRLTIFLLDTVVDKKNVMGGVFDSYGQNFLNDYNASINGESSSAPFQIRAMNNIDPADQMILDMIFNPGWAYIILFMWLVLTTITILDFHGAISSKFCFASVKKSRNDNK